MASKVGCTCRFPGASVSSRLYKPARSTMALAATFNAIAISGVTASRASAHSSNAATRFALDRNRYNTAISLDCAEACGSSMTTAARSIRRAVW